jgi:hypothetical protein
MLINWLLEVRPQKFYALSYRNERGVAQQGQQLFSSPGVLNRNEKQCSRFVTATMRLPYISYFEIYIRGSLTCI